MDNGHSLEIGSSSMAVMEAPLMEAPKSGAEVANGAEPSGIEAATESRESIPISALPQLPHRHAEYYVEPMCGICFVVGCCIFFVVMTQGLVNGSREVSLYLQLA